MPRDSIVNIDQPQETDSGVRAVEIEVLPPMRNPLLGFAGGVIGHFIERAFTTFVEKDRLPEKYQKLVQAVAFGSFCWGFAKDVREQYVLLKDRELELEVPTTRFYFQKSDIFYDLVKKWVRKQAPDSFASESRQYNIFTGINGEGSQKFRPPSIQTALDDEDPEQIYYPYDGLSFAECVVPSEQKEFTWNGIRVVFTPTTKTPSEDKTKPQFNMDMLDGFSDLDPSIQRAMMMSSYTEPTAELLIETEDLGVVSALFDEIKRAESVSRSLQVKDIIPSTMTYNFSYDEWRSHREISMKRSVFLPEDIEDALLQDVAEFVEREEWYEELGLPHKRGYLFYGLPGTGKTSTILAFAQHTKLDIFPIDLSKYTDEKLATAIKEIDSGIIIFEDIDCMFSGRTIKDAAGNSKTNSVRSMPTFSQFLNLIDGIDGRSSQIIIMTTNRALDEFDDALIRPGRIDVKVHFTYATDDQILRLTKKFFPDSPVEVERIVKEIHHMKPLTMCQVQEILIRETFGGKLKKIG